MDLANLLIIFLVGAASSLFGTLVGGSSLITIPVLILLGLPPHAAIGTDRMGVTGIGLAGLYKFHEKGLVRYKIGFFVAVPCLLGSFIGANLALQISPSAMKTAIAVMTVILLIIVSANPKIGVERTRHPHTNRTFATGSFFGLLVGIYGGFFWGRRRDLSLLSPDPCVWPNLP